jgi:glucose 1-dehydrogenase
MRLKGRSAIVTGAARGIGHACAERLVAEGARVILADIKDAEGAQSAAALGGMAHYLHCDVGDKTQVDRMIADVTAQHGAIDILINNAGISASGNILEISEADFDRVIRVNLKGAFLVGQAVARCMVEQVKAGRKPGAIVNMS